MLKTRVVARSQKRAGGKARSAKAILHELDHLVHRRLKRSVTESLEISFRIGRAFVELKAALPHGRFLPTVRERYDWSPDQAGNYMFLSQHSEEIRTLHRQHPTWNQWDLLEIVKGEERDAQTLSVSRADAELGEALSRGDLTFDHLREVRSLAHLCGWSGRGIWLQIARNPLHGNWTVERLRALREMVKKRTRDRATRALIVGGLSQPDHPLPMFFGLDGTGSPPSVTGLLEEHAQDGSPSLGPSVDDAAVAQGMLADVMETAGPLRNYVRRLQHGYEKFTAVRELLQPHTRERRELAEVLDETRQTIMQCMRSMDDLTPPPAQETFFPKGEAKPELVEVTS